MMKTRLSLLTLFIFGTSMQVLADTHVALQSGSTDQDNNGEFNVNVMFHGSVYASPCVFAPQSHLQIIELGEISARQFHQAGDRSKPVLIHIEFRDCLKGAAQARDSLASRTTGNNKYLYTTGEQAVQMTFMGESDEHNPQLLRLTGTTTGAGIRILDDKQRALDINQTQAPIIVKSGDSSQTYMATLESTGLNVTAGHFNGLLRLKMEYQ